MRAINFTFRIGAMLLFAVPLAAQPEAVLPVVDEFATVEDKLGAQAELEVALRDEAGQATIARDAASGSRPIILHLGYWTCPSACGPIFNRLLEGLRNADLVPGRDVDVLTISIDEREGPEMAAARKEAALEELGLPDVGQHWRFLTGDALAIRKLCDSVGYRYRRIEGTSQIDHPPVVVLLAADGTVTRYVDGQVMTPVTLRRAVVEAGDGTVGTFLEQLYVSCLTYDASRGEYSMAAMTVMRIGGVITVVALGLMIFVLWRRERQRPTAVAAT